MEAYLENALTLFFRQGALQLREPRFRKMPFRVKYDVLDTLPVLRNQIFELLDANIDHRDYDVIATPPYGCKYWPAIYADRHDLPFVMPVEVSFSNQTPLGLYGEQPIGSKVLMLNTINLPYAIDSMETHPCIRMFDILNAMHYKTVEIITLFNTDRLHVFNYFFSVNRSQHVVLKNIYQMQDILKSVVSAPLLYGVDMDLAQRAMKHYETNEIR